MWRAPRKRKQEQRKCMHNFSSKYKDHNFLYWLASGTSSGPIKKKMPAQNLIIHCCWHVAQKVVGRMEQY